MRCLSGVITAPLSAVAARVGAKVRTKVPARSPAEERIYWHSLSAVRERTEYTVDYSPTVALAVSEVWRALQAGKLHNDQRVVEVNLAAARIVRDLSLLYTMAPGLIPEAFVISHAGLEGSGYHSWYLKAVGKEIGVPKRLFSDYHQEHMIGSSLKPQGDNYLVPTFQAVLAKDYVASLTDTRARTEHRRHLGFG